jgi:hypothetical protein
LIQVKNGRELVAKQCLAAQGLGIRVWHRGRLACGFDKAVELMMGQPENVGIMEERRPILPRDAHAA